MGTTAVILIAIASQTPGTLPSGEEIVDRYVEAKGGKKLLESITSYRTVGEIRIDGEVTAKIQTYQRKNQHLTINRLSDGTQTSHGTNGTTAWYVDKTGTAKAIEGEDGLNYIRHHSTLHEALEWKSQFEHIRCIRLTPIDGQAVYEVHFIPKAGPTLVRFFDKSSGLLVREQRPLSEGGPLLISRMTDYRRINGNLVSHKRTNSVNGEETEFILLKAEYNVPFTDDRFDLPPSLPTDAD